MMIEIADFLGAPPSIRRAGVGTVSLLDHDARCHRPNYRTRTRVHLVPQRFVLRVGHHRLDEGAGLLLKLGQPHLQLLVAPDQLDRFQSDVEQALGVVRVVRNVLVVVVQLVVRMVWPGG